MKWRTVVGNLSVQTRNIILICASKGYAGAGLEGYPAPSIISTSRGSVLSDGRDGREWVIELVVIVSGSPDLSVVALLCVLLYGYIETTGVNNSFHCIKECYTPLFGETERTSLVVLRIVLQRFQRLYILYQRRLKYFRGIRRQLNNNFHKVDRSGERLRWFQVIRKPLF